MNIFLLLTLAYLVGSVPSGYLLVKIFWNVDVRTKGSGNIGATNVARVLGGFFRYFFIVFFLDFIKAFLFLYVTSYLVSSEHELLVLAAALLVGNGYSIFLAFYGGKGVATSFGILAFLASLQVFIFLILCFIVSFLASFEVSIASVVSFTAVCAYYLIAFERSSSFAIFLIFMLIWILLRHRVNILNRLGAR